MLEEIQLQQVLPQEIEKRSFEIITEELGNVELDPLQAPIIKRAIHTSADFDYLKNLTFSELAVEQFHTAIKNGACIVTDTQMAKSGINKKELAKYGGEVYCFMSDDDVAEIAKKQGSTRAVGFVNVVEAKELIMRTPVPYIVARGRKGGSNIAAAICNALLYELRDMEK